MYVKTAPKLQDSRPIQPGGLSVCHTYDVDAKFHGTQYVNICYILQLGGSGVITDSTYYKMHVHLRILTVCCHH